MPTKKAISVKPVVKNAAVQLAPTGGNCGYKIDRVAKAGSMVQASECAFTTYALEPGVAVALSQPTVAFYGPGDRVLPQFGAGPGTYYFVAGVIFKNC